MAYQNFHKIYTNEKRKIFKKKKKTQHKHLLQWQNSCSISCMTSWSYKYEFCFLQKCIFPHSISFKHTHTHTSLQFGNTYIHTYVYFVICMYVCACLYMEYFACFFLTFFLFQIKSNKFYRFVKLKKLQNIIKKKK